MVTAQHTDGSSGFASSSRREIILPTMKRAPRRYLPLHWWCSSCPSMDAPPFALGSPAQKELLHLPPQGRHRAHLVLALVGDRSHRHTRTNSLRCVSVGLARLRARTFSVFGIALMNPKRRDSTGRVDSRFSLSVLMSIWCATCAQ